MGRYCFLVDTPVALAMFREKYNIPDDVHLELSVEDTTPWGRLDQCPFIVLSIIEGGLRFPVNPLIWEFLRRTGLAPTQVSTNTYRIMNGIHELNNRLGTNLGLAEILCQYTLRHTGDGLTYYLKIRPGKEKIVTGTPDKDLHGNNFSGCLQSKPCKPTIIIPTKQPSEPCSDTATGIATSSLVTNRHTDIQVHVGVKSQTFFALHLHLPIPHYRMCHSSG
ncbi:hypothetical protein CsSME_00039992 [Camellia sinensis var. sinensis]